jgi:hypothetical protein
MDGVAAAVRKNSRAKIFLSHPIPRKGVSSQGASGFVNNGGEQANQATRWGCKESVA